MKSEIIFSGVGGQGIMLIGKMLCSAAAKKCYQVTFAPTYGQEKRGGRTSCQIVISDTVDSPVISEADIVMIMDENSLVDFEDKVKKDSYLIVNSSMIEKEISRHDIKVIKVPINDIAKEIGNSKSANIVALGIVLKYINCISLEDIEDYLGKTFKGSAVESNRDALQAGFNYAIN